MEGKKMEEKNMEKNAPCSIVEDLLPLYAEGMCSDETGSFVEEHIKECMTCKEKLEYYKENLEQMIRPETEDGKKTVEEIRPMKKINKKIRKNRYINILLSVLLLAFIGVNAFLSYGQFFPESGAPSYELLFERAHIRSICKEMFNGNPEILAECMDYSMYENTFLMAVGDPSSYFQTLQQMLKETFEENIDGKKVEIKGIESNYINESMWDEKGHYYVCTDVEIEVDGKELQLIFEKMGNGIYRIDCTNDSKDSGLDSFAKVINYANGDAGLLQQWLLEKWTEAVYHETADGEGNQEIDRTGHFTSYFVTDSMKQSDDTEEYQKALASRLAALAQEGICIKDCYGKEAHYDEKDGRVIQQFLFVFERLETGEQITLSQDFYYGPLGYEPAGDGRVMECQEPEEIQNSIAAMFKWNKM